jgi:hypothetical protein
MLVWISSRLCIETWRVGEAVEVVQSTRCKCNTFHTAQPSETKAKGEAVPAL